MGFCSWILFGAIAGWIASLITGRSDRMGCLGNILVGIAGAAIGGAIVGLFGGAGFTGFNFSSLLVAVLGAVVLLAIFNLVFGRSSS